MKLNKGIIFGIIGVFIGAISVYAFTGTPQDTDQTVLDHTTANTHGEHGIHDKGQAEDNAIPTMPGQAAFGAIQEIIAILENDPNTDWSQVDIPALKRHLIDMNELTLNAEVEETELENGLQMKVTGQGRTIDAIHRMVSTHVEMTLSRIEAWDINLKMLDNGAILTATSQIPDEVQHIKGLGFIGLMATGADHPLHHLMMAKGEMH
ncbi:MAG: hypothetical protein H0Z33_12170 [Bacillaceae bacterium]|nr:hypothetical protein [Bacillaceae bacterium]